MSKNSIYQWLPKQGYSHKAVARIRKHSQKPSYLMGEAWFLSEERRLYPELNQESPLEKIKTIDVSSIIFEIASGTKCFGHNEEWDEWFRYLLPDFICHSQDFQYFETMLVQDVISAFMSIYWKGIPEEYKGFRDDVISSLSLCLMNEDLWYDYPDAEMGQTLSRPIFLDTFKDGRGELRLGWNAEKSDENLSAMMFFCLKYLNPDEIITWTKSLFSIRDVYWRGALMVWINAASDILSEPEIIPSRIENSKPEINWMTSHLLVNGDNSNGADNSSIDFNADRNFLPAENPKLFLEEIRKMMTEELIMEWAAQFSKDAFVAESTYNVPEFLMEKFFP